MWSSTCLVPSRTQTSQKLKPENDHEYVDACVILQDNPTNSYVGQAHDQRFHLPCALAEARYYEKEILCTMAKVLKHESIRHHGQHCLDLKPSDVLKALFTLQEVMDMLLKVLSKAEAPEPEPANSKGGAP